MNCPAFYLGDRNIKSLRDLAESKKHFLSASVKADGNFDNSQRPNQFQKDLFAIIGINQRAKTSSNPQKPHSVSEAAEIFSHPVHGSLRGQYSYTKYLAAAVYNRPR